jgi:hypothetical protein
MNIKTTENLDTTIVLQIQYLLKNTFQSRLGLVCFYMDKILIADTTEELHNLLQAIWK